MCCAWTIHTTEDHWHGKGVISGYSENNYSGCSKSFGILMALMFLQHYLNHFPSIPSQSLLLATVYCNSESILTKSYAPYERQPHFPTTLSKMITTCTARSSMLSANSHNSASHSDTLKGIKINCNICNLVSGVGIWLTQLNSNWRCIGQH